MNKVLDRHFSGAYNLNISKGLMVSNLKKYVAEKYRVPLRRIQKKQGQVTADRMFNALCAIETANPNLPTEFLTEVRQTSDIKARLILSNNLRQQ